MVAADAERVRQNRGTQLGVLGGVRTYMGSGVAVVVVAVCTLDLRSGKQTRAFDDRSSAYTGIADLRIAPSGSLGLMEYEVRYTGDSGPSTNRVVTVTASGSAVVDAGEDIDRSSLALGGSWLYWTRASQPRSAPLR